jgi:hypothetical protein
MGLNPPSSHKLQIQGSNSADLKTSKAGGSETALLRLHAIHTHTHTLSLSLSHTHTHTHTHTHNLLTGQMQSSKSTTFKSHLGLRTTA